MGISKTLCAIAEGLKICGVGEDTMFAIVCLLKTPQQEEEMLEYMLAMETPESSEKLLERAVYISKRI